jgi:hypothetical protein
MSWFTTNGAKRGPAASGPVAAAVSMHATAGLIVGGSSSGSLPYGLGVNSSQLDYSYDRTTQYEQAQAMGMQWFRNDVTWNAARSDWPGFELTPGDYNSEAADLINEAASAMGDYGLSPLWVVTTYTTLTDTWSSGYPTTPAQFGDAMAWLVAQCPGMHWELFNEPDINVGDYNPSISSSLLIAAYQAAYPAMKAADPTCTVHGFVVANVNEGGSGYTLANELYEGGIQGYYDETSIHMYQFPTDTPPDDEGDNGPLLTQWSDWQGLRATYGDETGIFISETGYKSTSDGDMTPTLQSEYIIQWLTELEGDPSDEGLDAVLIYQSNDSGDYYGISDTDYTPKPVYDALIAINT